MKDQGLISKPVVDLFGMRPEQIAAIENARKHYQTYGKLEWPEGKTLRLEEARAKMNELKANNEYVNEYTGDKTITFTPAVTYDPLNDLPPKPDRAKHLYRCQHCLSYYWLRTLWSRCERDCLRGVNDRNELRATQKKAAEVAAKK